MGGLPSHTRRTPLNTQQLLAALRAAAAAGDGNAAAFLRSGIGASLRLGAMH
jgi:hypothetical protein